MEAEGPMLRLNGRNFLLVFAFAAWSAFAQTPATLTNADIAGMLKAHVPEDTIILAIRTAAANGTARFDTSSEALIQLEKAGASNRILTTLVDTPVNPVAGLPTAAGVYFSGASGWQKVPMQQLWAPYFSSSLKVRNYDTTLPVSEPEVQLENGMPCFYARAYPLPTDWTLAYVGEKHQLFAKVDNEMQPKLHISKAQLRPITVAALSLEVQTIKPQAALLPGDYALCALVPGTGDFLKCYSFRVGP
jgi:hypothetical protein